MAVCEVPGSRWVGTGNLVRLDQSQATESTRFSARSRV